MLIPSANDAANALAEHVGGNIESFSTMMNSRAKELGCIKVNNNRLYTPKKNVDKWNEEREKGFKKLEQLIKR